MTACAVGWLVHDGRAARDLLPRAWHNSPLQLLRSILSRRSGLATAPGQTRASARPVTYLSYLRSMQASGGLGGLYQGLSANLAGSMASWGAYFYLYEKMKDAVRQWRSAPALHPLDYFVTSSFAGTSEVPPPVVVGLSGMCDVCSRISPMWQVC